ncbi:MAG: CHAT domain-containing protein [Bacteroidota bacterium]|nr:CHAT domain-containing protein [Bacteroidota bacterium]
MKIIATITLLLSLSITGFTQDRSLQDLYHRTTEISDLINDAQHLEALDGADRIISIYGDFPGAPRYLCYLYMYKAEAFLSLGDLMLSRHCNILAMRFAKESANLEIQFMIRNNTAVLDLESQKHQSCFDQCSEMIKDPRFKPGLDVKAMIQNNMALCALKLNNKQAADTLFPELFNIGNMNLKFQYYDPVLTYRNYGLYLRQQGENDQACHFLNVALNRYLDSLGFNHYQTGQTLLYLGECYQALGEKDSALICLDQSLSILDPDRSSHVSSQNELARIQAYKAKAELWLSERNYQEALTNIEEAIKKIEFVMQSYAATESGFILANLVRPVYNIAVHVSVELYKRDKKMEFFFKALNYSDQGKRMSLKARILNFQRVEYSPALEDVYKSFYNTRLLLSDNQQDESILISLVQEHSRNRKRLDSLLGLPSVQNTSGYNGDYDRITNVMKPLISFHDFGDYYALFFTDGKSCRYLEIEKDFKLNQTIRQLLDDISRKRTGDYSHEELEVFIAQSAYLYKRLIEPIGRIKKGVLYIQTDGDLEGFPFEVLLSAEEQAIQKNKPTNFNNLPYLLKNHSILYLSSIHTVTHKTEMGRKELSFIITDLNKPNASSKKEWQFLCQQYNGVVVEGFQATSNILHFTGHSVVDLQNQYKSSLGKGYNWLDILQMNNLGKKVYLNSCETGLGRYNPGEGPMSLGMAFLLSGVDQLVETFWITADSQASDIAGLFHRYGGFNQPEKALQQSKLEFLENCQPGSDHPHYWAGIMVQGRGTQDSKSISLFLLFIGAGLLAAFLIFCFHKRCRK